MEKGRKIETPKRWVKITRSQEPEETKNEDLKQKTWVQVKYNDNTKAIFYEDGMQIHHFSLIYLMI